MSKKSKDGDVTSYGIGHVTWSPDFIKQAQSLAKDDTTAADVRLKLIEARDKLYSSLKDGENLNHYDWIELGFYTEEIFRLFRLLTKEE